jgi:predicted MFS family arabinose efflux permease
MSEQVSQTSPDTAGRLRPARMFALARWAVTAVFVVNGMVIGSLAVRTPSLKIEHGLTDGRLGLISALFGISAVISMQLAGRLTARVGSARVLRTAAVALPCTLLSLGLVDGILPLAAAMVIFGAVHGQVDVAMNAHAVAVEREWRRPILNGCHAGWSIGAIAGSLAGGAAAQAGWSLAPHFLVLAAVLVSGALVVCRGLLPASADRRSGRPADGTRRGSWRTGWTPRLLLLGAMGGTVLTCEAAVASWSGVYLHDELGASLGAASLGYIAFIGCQTSGRLVGDRLFTRFPARVLVGGGALIAAAGMALVVISPWPALSIAGFFVVGLGMATPLPVLFSVVGHGGADGPGAADHLARFTTMTYSGILLGPALIGWLAQGIGLTWTLAALVPLLIALFPLSGAVLDRQEVKEVSG